MFRVYKDDEVVVEGVSPLSITGISPNTDVAKGEYQIVRVINEKESERVDIPAFKTLPVKVTGVTLSPKTSTGETGTAGEQQLTAAVAPSNATNKTVVYSIAPITDGLSVNASGKITWTEDVPAGTYTVTVTTADGSKTDTSTLVLSEPEIPVDTVTVSPKSVQLEVGGTQQLTSEVLPANATNKVVNYSTDDEAIASVGSDGLVTAVAVGTATITAESYYDGSKLDTCVVEVAEPDPEPEPDPEG